MNPEEKTTNHQRHSAGVSPKRVNLQYLNDLSGGDTEFIIEVIDMFLGVAPDSVKHLLTYEKSENYTLIKSTVHKLKPTLQMLGDEELHIMAADIEETCLNGGPANDADKAALGTKISGFARDAQVLIRELEHVAGELRLGK